MSQRRASETGATQDKPECSLAKAVEDVCLHGYAQTDTLKEKQRTLSSMQARRSEVENKAEKAEQELRCTTRELLMIEAEMEHLEQRANVLHDRCVSISKENAELQIKIKEEEESAEMALKEFSTYQTKMESHRAAVLHAASQTDGHKVLEEKRALVRMLTQKKEQLREDLGNPNGNTVQRAKGETDALKAEISAVRKMTAESRERLRKEAEIQTHLRKDIEIQNRRFEAIVKRLHRQLSRAQAVHRQTSEDVYHMQRELAELKRQLESSQDSTVASASLGHLTACEMTVPLLANKGVTVLLQP
uniref:coiled-coil domain-containing protein 122-like n=1 Tax=Scatophagus argus TaxID=75038 RepID=UPI001ED7E926|nr:coiled-coil domain-containing protein 122-like [Scatophagus argus]